jgi:hypothetical protein
LFSKILKKTTKKSAAVIAAISNKDEFKPQTITVTASARLPSDMSIDSDGCYEEPSSPAIGWNNDTDDDSRLHEECTFSVNYDGDVHDDSVESGMSLMDKRRKNIERNRNFLLSLGLLGDPPTVTNATDEIDCASASSRADNDIHKNRAFADDESFREKKLNVFHEMFPHRISMLHRLICYLNNVCILKYTMLYRVFINDKGSLCDVVCRTSILPQQ